MQDEIAQEANVYMLHNVAGVETMLPRQRGWDGGHALGDEQGEIKAGRSLSRDLISTEGHHTETGKGY